MIALDRFNQLDRAQAEALLLPCVAIPGWAGSVAAGRPYPDSAALLQAGRDAARHWQAAELTQALSAHPRIGEKPEAGLSRQEQSAVDERDAALTQALRDGNARYEARFDRVFLIRAKGRDGQEILQALHRRLHNSDEQEIAEALEQLREITLLRLEGVISE